MTKSAQRVPTGKIEAEDRRLAMLLIQTPAEKKLLMWHSEKTDLRVQYLAIERTHPSIIRDWGINE